LNEKAEAFLNLLATIVTQLYKMSYCDGEINHKTSFDDSVRDHNNFAEWIWLAEWIWFRRTGDR
jgi:hypothetical protein